MSFLKRLDVCGSSRVSFAIVCLGTCLIRLNWLMYELEDGENAPGLGPNSEVTTEEASTAQLPVTLSGCFITTSGKCLHTAVCHHGKRAEVKTLRVKISVCQMTPGSFHTLLKFIWIGMTVCINPEFVKIFIVDIVIFQKLQSRGL